MIEIKYLKAFKDNYIWLMLEQVQSSGQVAYLNKKCIVVDPGESKQVVDYIIANGLELHSILLTHSHHDHVGGVADLLNLYPVPVYGVQANPYATMYVNDGDVFEILSGVSIKTLTTPGHTIDGVSFLINDKYLFCGDTFFSAGCGRVFTNDYQLMYESLLKIKSLPHDTIIYPAHEYTLNNLYFAKNVEPNNMDIINRTKQIEKIRLDDGITLPTNLQLELMTNPFLRCDLPVFNLPHNKKMTELEKFIQLRQMKDAF